MKGPTHGRRVSEVEEFKEGHRIEKDLVLAGVLLSKVFHDVVLDVNVT